MHNVKGMYHVASPGWKDHIGLRWLCWDQSYFSLSPLEIKIWKSRQPLTQLHKADFSSKFVQVLNLKGVKNHSYGYFKLTGSICIPPHKMASHGCPNTKSDLRQLKKTCGSKTRTEFTVMVTAVPNTSDESSLVSSTIFFTDGYEGRLLSTCFLPPCRWCTFWFSRRR